MKKDEILNSLIEVKLPDSDAFLKVRETLSRIGVASKKDKTLYQSVHILHKQGRYFLPHFKEMFLLDGKRSDFSEEDKGRRNTERLFQLAKPSKGWRRFKSKAGRFAGERARRGEKAAAK